MIFDLLNRLFYEGELKINVTEICVNLFIDKMLVRSMKSSSSVLTEAMFCRKLMYYKDSD